MRHQAHLERLLARLFLVCLSVGLSFILVEASARLLLRYVASPEQVTWYASIPQALERPDSTPKFVPHRYLGYIPTPGYQRGGNRHNSLGFRGNEISRQKLPTVLRIVCVGGSTVYSDGVDDFRQSYPHLLEAGLNDGGLANVEVVNAGVPGYGTLESLINFQSRILDLAPDLIVVYHGFNDVHSRLVWPGDAFRGDNSGHNGLSWRGRSASLWERSTLLRALMLRFGAIEPQTSLRRSFGSPPETDRSLDFWMQVRDGRYPEGLFQTTPASEMMTENGPDYFERNLRGLVSLAAANEVAVVLTTFAYAPTFVGGSRMATLEYQAAIAEQNAVVRSIVSGGGATLLDLAELVPDEGRYFVDGYHFSSAGNQLRAHHTANHLRDTGLLSPAPSGAAR